MDVLTVSNSQIDVWDRCERRWEFNYIDGIVPKKEKSYFQKGTFAHELLATHFRAKRDGIRETWPVVVGFIKEYKFDLSDSDQITLFKDAVRIVERYIREYAPKNDRFRILDVERHFVVEMITPKGRLYRLQGYFDLLIEWDGKLWIVDHKTVGQGKFWSLNELLMEPQFATYLLGLREQGYDVFGCVINQLNTYDYKDFEAQPVEKLFRREKVYRTDKQIENQSRHIGKIVDEMIDHEDDYRKSFRKDCPRCPYFFPCLYETKGMDISAELAVNFKKREPRPVENQEEVETETDTGWAR